MLPSEDNDWGSGYEKMDKRSLTDSRPVSSTNVSTDSLEIGSTVAINPSSGEYQLMTSSADFKERSYQLFTKRNVPHPTSNLDTMMHIIKGNIGTGILAMPDALRNSGLTVGTVGIAIIATLSIHCMHVLLKCSRFLCVKTDTVVLDFATASETAFAKGPVPLRRYAPVFRFLTNLFLCLTMLGFCCVYVVFVATNIKEIVDEETSVKLDYRIYVAILVLPIIATNLFRNLKLLVPASIAANILEVLSLAIIFYYVFQDLPPASSRKQFASFSQLPLWFGTVIFAFEGIGLVLPLENNMKTPRDFGGLTGVLNTAMVIVSCLYIGMGFFGYLKYGDDVEGSITFNLPHEIPGYIARTCYSVAIFLSYAIQFYVPIALMFPFFQRRINPRYHFPAEVAFRIIVILITISLAILIPQLDLFISLVGAFSGSYLALILPPILEIVTFWDEGISKLTIFKDVLIAVIGVVGFATGTFTSILNIINTFGKTQSS